MKPTKKQLEDARGKTVADVIAPRLTFLFCGINPGLYTAAVGHHFARPGNRFWITLYRSGFTPHQFSPDEERKLLAIGIGITNVVGRATAKASEIGPEEYRIGARLLEEKILAYVPRFLVCLGVGAYRIGFNRPHAVLGLQKETVGATRLWVLPNPSGLNASYHLNDLVRLFADLKAAAQT